MMNQLLQGETMAERAKNLLKARNLLDCTFLVGPERKVVMASRIHLIIASPKFERMLQLEDNKSKNTCIVLEHELKTFEKLIELTFYPAGNFENREEAEKVVALAHQYSMKDIMEHCEHYLKPKTIDEYFQSVEVASLYKLDILNDACAQVASNKMSLILKDSRFLKLSPISVAAVLKGSNMNIDSELDLFNAAVKWAIAECTRRNLTPSNPKNLRLVLDEGDVIKQIRFLAMSLEAFRSGPYKSGILRENEVSAIFSNIDEKTIVDIPKTLSSETVRREVQNGSILWYHTAHLYVDQSNQYHSADRTQRNYVLGCPRFAGMLHMSSYNVNFLITCEKPVVIMGVTLSSQNRPEGLSQIDEEYSEKVTVTFTSADGNFKHKGSYDSYYNGKIKYCSEIYVEFSLDRITTFYPGDTLQFEVEYDKRGAYLQRTQNREMNIFKQISPYNTICKIHYGTYKWK